jgi:hypothetical protein
MDRPKLSAAFQKAIAVSKLAEAIPSASTPGADLAISPGEQNVQIEATPLAELVSVLRELPPFSADGALGLCDGLGGGQIDFDEVARAVLAEGLRTGDIDRAVSELVDVVEKNEGKAPLIMALRGVEVGKELDLGASVSLLPLQDIPRSFARGVAQGQAEFPLSILVPRPVPPLSRR